MEPELDAPRDEPASRAGRAPSPGPGEGPSEGPDRGPSDPAIDPEHLLRRMFRAAVDAVGADACVPGALPEPAGGRTVVVGAGKAAAAMARAVEREWSVRGHPPPRGVVVTRYGHAVDCRHIEVIEAAHPVPDAAGRAAADRVLGLAGELGAEDLLLCLVSGGGSALLVAPAPGVTLDEKQALNRALLASGANITEMNTVRKHLSRIKGGRLAAASHPARCHAVLLSDVPGDDPATIASGPTVADPTTVADARAVAERYRVALPASVRAWWERPESETPKPGDPRLARSTVDIVANAQQALDAAAAVAREHGYEALILGDTIEGEARDVALVHAGIARQVRLRGQPAPPPCVILSGGETTVTVRGGRTRRAQCGVSSRPRGRPRRPARGLRARRRHRRDRRHRGERGGGLPAGLHGEGARPRARPPRRPRLERRVRVLRGARRARRDRADPDQRQRLPGGRDHGPGAVKPATVQARRGAGEPAVRRSRKAKIMATLGPASDDRETIARPVPGRGGSLPAQLQPRRGGGPPTAGGDHPCGGTGRRTPDRDPARPPGAEVPARDVRGGRDGGGAPRRAVPARSRRAPGRLPGG